MITTEAGSLYEVDGLRVRRTNLNTEKRGDEEWQTLFAMFPLTPIVGFPMVFVMRSLSECGPDDFGTPEDLGSEETTRTTSRVTHVSGIHEPKES